MTTEMEPWRDRVALVTGGSSGIGAAIVRRLLAGGMRVATCARRLDRLDALAAEVADRPARERLRRFEVDLRDEPQILALFAAVAADWGGVDVLVNNAGLGYHAPLVSGATADWREMIEVNLIALSICTREAIAQMRARGVAGHVLHISSMAGHRVPPESGIYAATKFGVTALTEALRQELRALDSPIRVTAISPGYVETEFAQLFHRDPAAGAATYGRFPVLQPDDLAEAVVYALSQPPHVQIHDILLRPTRQPN